MPELKAKLSLDGQQFFSTMKMADAAAQKFSTSTKNYLASAFAAGAVVGALRAIKNFASQIQDTADRFDVSTDAVQTLDFIAKQTGTTLDQFGTALDRLAKSRAAALEDPDGKEAKAFAAFGVNAATLKNARLEDILSAISVAFKSVGDSQVLAADGMTLMGRSASKVFPALKFGLTDAANAARELNQIASPEGIRAVDDWGDAFDRLLKKIKVFGIEGGSHVAKFHSELGNILDAIGRYAQAAGQAITPGGKGAGEAFGEAHQKDRSATWQTKHKGGAMTFPRGHLGGAGYVEPPLGPDSPEKVKADAEYAHALLAEHEKLRDIEFDRMNIAEKRASLERDVLNLLGRRSHFESDSLGDALERAKIDAEIAGKQLRSSLLIDPIVKPDMGDPFTPRLNELQQIGGYAGPGDNQLRSQLDRQLQKLDQMIQKQEEGNRIARENSSKFE